MKKRDTKDLLHQIRTGVRLATPPPKREVPKNVYNRKDKHKRRPEASSYHFWVSFV